MVSLRIIKLYWTFYKSFAFFSFLINISCLYAFYIYEWEIFKGIFWLKALTVAITYVFMNRRKGKEYYYYHNLGISKPALWIPLLLMEILIFIALIYLMHRLY